MSSLSLALGHHPISLAATAELAAAHGLEIDRREVDPIHNAFAPMIRKQQYDICELAIVSAMQAFAYDKPLILLPVTLAARYQHKCIVCNGERGAFDTKALPGKRVGVRAYTQTTGAWVRTILQSEYGVPPMDMRWITQVGAHVSEYQDPPQIERVDRTKSLLEMLRTGEIDAAIFGNDLPDLPWLAPVIPDAEHAGATAFARTSVVPINHIVSIRKDLVRQKPGIMGDVMAFFRAAKAASQADEGPDLYPIGLDAMRASVEAILGSAWDQKLLPRRIAFEELFGPALDTLGDAAL